MTEQSGERAEPMRIAPADLMSEGFFLSPPRPRVVVRRDLLPALSVLSFISLFGLLIGWIWSLLAPPQKMLVDSNAQLVPLANESAHRFDDLALFVVLGFGFGVIVGYAVWLLRERRGPMIMFAAVLGSALGAWLAMQVGVSFAGGHYVINGTPHVGDLLSKAPILESPWVLIAQPLTTALAYGMLSAWNNRDDLGRRLG